MSIEWPFVSTLYITIKYKLDIGSNYAVTLTKFFAAKSVIEIKAINCH